MSATTALIASALLVVVIYLLAGRLLLAHTGRNHEATPLQAFLTGGALWWLWSVLGHGLLVIPLGTLWWLYLIAVAGLSLVLGKTHYNEGHGHTFWSRVFLVALLACPWIVALVQHVPTQLAEMKFDALWPVFIMVANGLPSAAEVTHFNMLQASAGSGFAWIGMPLATTQGYYTDSLLPVFNVILLGFLATEMVRWRGITLDQDRVFAVIPAAVILVAVVVGIFGAGWVWSSLPYVLLASLAIAIARILSEEQPPVGLAALNLALLVMLLAQVTVFGPLFACGAMVFYIYCVFKAQVSSQSMLGMLLVALLPLMGMGLWISTMLNAGYPAPGGIMLGLFQPQMLLHWPVPEAILTLVVVGALYGIFIGAEKVTTGLGFHRLGLGASFILLGLGIVSAHATRPQENINIASGHVLAVAETLQHVYLKPGESIAVLDRSPYYSGMLRARLGHNNPVLNMGLPDDLATLQGKLQHLGVKYLWVHAPDDQVRGVMDVHMQNTASYLYLLGTDGLILKAVFPHPGYTSANL